MSRDTDTLTLVRYLRGATYLAAFEGIAIAIGLLLTYFAPVELDDRIQMLLLAPIMLSMVASTVTCFVLLALRALDRSRRMHGSPAPVHVSAGRGLAIAFHVLLTLLAFACASRFG